MIVHLRKALSIPFLSFYHIVNIFKQITTKTNSRQPFERLKPIVLHKEDKDHIPKKNIWDNYKFCKEERQYLRESINKINSNKVDQTNKKRKQSGGVTLRRSKRLKNTSGNPDEVIDLELDETPVSDDNSINKMLGWVSATKTKNYLLDDQCIDWLNMYYDKYGITSTSLTSTYTQLNTDLLKDASHIDILLDGGNVFERKVYEELKDIYDDDFVIVFNEEDMIKYREQKTINGMIREKNMYVKELMLQGVPIIAQAPLINDENMTFGVADILIRSDYLSVVFKQFTPDDDIHVKAPLLNIGTTKNNYHYRVIDCKWTTMILCVDGTTIRNEGYFPAYKGQLAVYTACLESLQGYIPHYAYIMAKAWKIDKANITNSDKNMYRGFSAFDRPGVIDYSKKDNAYLGKTKDAIKWVQRVMIEGCDWRYYADKPSVPEMYPNMNKSFNPAYDKVKSILALRYGDPTMVWYVGSEHRRNMNAKGIYSTNHVDCNTKALGITSPVRGYIIDEILDINRESRMNHVTDVVRPLCIKNNLANWQKSQGLDYYVDFETIYYNLFVNPYDMNIDSSFFDADVSFMIGIGFNHDSNIDSNKLMSSLGFDKTQYNYVHTIDRENNWEFLCLYLVKFEIKNELELVRVFAQFILARSEFYKAIYKINNIGFGDNAKSRFFHWTGAEIRFINSAINRIRSGSYTNTHMKNPTLTFNNENTNDVQKYLNDMINTFEQKTIWVDMCRVFETEPIVIKGSYRFKLKHVGNAFYNNKLINTKWDDGKMSDGFRAMLEAIKLYRANSTITSTNDTFREIIDYNEIDCKVIWEIVNYLRTNHCKIVCE